VLENIFFCQCVEKREEKREKNCIKLSESQKKAEKRKEKESTSSEDITANSIQAIFMY
jgi:hypothetical protein